MVVVVVFFNCSRKMSKHFIKLHHDLFLLNSSLFIVILSCDNLSCELLAISLNKPSVVIVYWSRIVNKM